MEILIPRNNLPLNLSPRSLAGEFSGKPEQISPIFANRFEEEEKQGSPEPQIKEYMLEQIRQAIKFKV